nr:hypothetical protein [Tanacetum cinerariifolium]
EREYLEEIKEKLTLAVRRVDEAVRQFSDELQQKKEYIHEHQSGMDDADMVAAGQSINRMAFTGGAAGTIESKRQYKIRDGQLEFMIENGVNIHDDVLQRELAKSSDDKLKNIVATIQRDQNAVIRNESAS